VSTKDTNPKDMVGTRKAPLSCVPMNVVAEMGVGMLDGATKYGRHNYRIAGIRASVYFDAAMRHLLAWWEGEDIDPDSGMHHVTKALTTLAVLRDAQMNGMVTDDRPPIPTPFYGQLNKLAAGLVDRKVDKEPRHYTISDSKIPVPEVTLWPTDDEGWVKAPTDDQKRALEEERNKALSEALKAVPILPPLRPVFDDMSSFERRAQLLDDLGE